MRAPGRGSGPALPHNPARRGWGGKGSLLPRAAGEGHCDHSSRTSKSPQICYFLGSLGQPGKKAESDAMAEGAQAQGGATTFPGVPQQARDTAKASTPHRSCLLSPDAQRPQLEQSLTQHTPWLSQKACCPRRDHAGGREDTKGHSVFSGKSGPGPDCKGQKASHRRGRQPRPGSSALREVTVFSFPLIMP